MNIEGGGDNKLKVGVCSNTLHLLYRIETCSLSNSPKISYSYPKENHLPAYGPMGQHYSSWVTRTVDWTVD